MSYTSSEVKNRYMRKAYDRINILVARGDRELIKQAAAAQGKSVNQFIKDLIYNNLQTTPSNKITDFYQCKKWKPPDIYK